MTSNKNNNNNYKQKTNQKKKVGNKDLVQKNQYKKKVFKMFVLLSKQIIKSMRCEKDNKLLLSSFLFITVVFYLKVIDLVKLSNIVTPKKVS